ARDRGPRPAKFTLQRDHQHRRRGANAGRGQEHKKSNARDDPGVVNSWTMRLALRQPHLRGNHFSSKTRSCEAIEMLPEHRAMKFFAARLPLPPWLAVSQRSRPTCQTGQLYIAGIAFHAKLLNQLGAVQRESGFPANLAGLRIVSVHIRQKDAHRTQSK